MSITDKVTKTNVNRILAVDEPKYSLHNIDVIIKKIKNKIDSKNNIEIIKDLRKFLSYEIKIK